MGGSQQAAVAVPQKELFLLPRMFSQPESPNLVAAIIARQTSVGIFASSTLFYILNVTLALLSVIITNLGTIVAASTLILPTFLTQALTVHGRATSSNVQQ
jgi:hypothetical protein